MLENDIADSEDEECEEESEGVQLLLDKIDNEGLDYALRVSCSWKELESIDPTLYTLIQKYNETAEEICGRLRTEYGADWIY